MTPGVLYGISLGTGAPDLLTLRADKLLRQAERIYYAATPHGEGEGHRSYALEILRDYPFAQGVLRPLCIEMSLDKGAAQAAYEQAFGEMLAECRAGRRVAFVCEGDISFYSSFGRLLSLAAAQGLPCEMVPGVSSFLHLCSEERRLLAAGTQRVAVVPLLKDRAELQRLMRDFDVLVLIKLRRALAVVADELAGGAAWTVVLGSLLGSEQQRLRHGARALLEDEPPYLSVMILRRNDT